MSQSPTSQAAVNRAWVRQLFAVLDHYGVRHACVAPGSRSTPLTLEAEKSPNIQVHTHFDERGLGFMALGMAKVSHSPIAIIVTSGTAVANLLPAVAEANLTGEKLILLTADRPPELIGIGANQAIVQSGIFSSHVTRAVELPCPSLSTIHADLIAPIQQAIELQVSQGGAVHINCPFREPLYVTHESDVDEAFHQLGQLNLEHKRSPVEPIESIALKANGLVIIGSVSLDDAHVAKQFAESMGWPVLCDVQCGISSEFAGFDVWLPLCKQRAFDKVTQVVQFGARVVSKRLNHWLIEQNQRCSDFDYHVVSADWRKIDPNLIGAQQHNAAVSAWVDAQHLPEKTKNTYDQEKRAAKALATLVQKHVATVKPINEVSIAAALGPFSSQCDLFIGNSLIVRLMDMVSTLNNVEVYSNRGASGIDGLIATSHGVQQMRERPLVTVLGDTSLLYDLNSLALLNKTSAPAVVVVINNDGGAIFDMLPVDPHHREKLYQMPHGLNFDAVSTMFNLGYACPSTVGELHLLIEAHLNSGVGTLLVEAVVEPGQAKQHLTYLKSTLAQSLHESN